MKVFKLVLLAAVLLFMALVVVQNREVFAHQEALRLNLWIKAYETPNVQLSIYFLGFFLTGFLLSYFNGLSERFRARSAIKKHLQKISKLEEEIKVLKSLPLQEENLSSQDTEPA